METWKFCSEFKKNLIHNFFAINYDFLIPMSLQSDVVDLDKKSFGYDSISLLSLMDKLGV